MHMSPALSLPHVVVKAILIGAMMMLIFLYLVYENKYRYEKETQYILIIGCLYEYNYKRENNCSFVESKGMKIESNESSNEDDQSFRDDVV